MYFLTFIFLILLFTTNKFITGIYQYSWGNFPKTVFIHYFHTVFVMATAIYAVYLLWQGMQSIKLKRGKTKKYYECKYIFLAFTFVTLGGSDFLHNWGIDFFPLGCIFVTLFVVFITYAIFKHELLGISIVIKKSLIYSILISIMTAMYFASVYVIGMFLGDLTKTHSTILVLSMLILITLLFKPLETKLNQSIDRLIFKRPREAIEKENELF